MRVDQEVVRKFWAGRARSERLRWSSESILDNDVSEILGALKFAPLTVLDLGCGDGELLFRVLGAFPEATAEAVDFEPTLARHFECEPRVEFRECDIRMYDTPHRFDLVLAFGFATYLDDEEAQSFYATLARVLNSDGVAFVKHQTTLGQTFFVNRYSEELGAEYSARYPNEEEEAKVLKKHFSSVAIRPYPDHLNPHRNSRHSLFICRGALGAGIAHR